MKKILLITALVLLSFSGTFAIDMYDYKVFYKLNNENTFISLKRYLKIDKEQEDQLKYVFELTEKKLKTAIYKENEVAAENAMWFNLGNVKMILTPEQYKNYLTVINMSIINKNDVYLAEK